MQNENMQSVPGLLTNIVVSRTIELDTVFATAVVALSCRIEWHGWGPDWKVGSAR